MRIAGEASPFNHVKEIVIVVVNSLSSPSTGWNKSVNGPGSIELLIQATGVPIDHYSYEEIESLKNSELYQKAVAATPLIVSDGINNPTALRIKCINDWIAKNTAAIAANEKIIKNLTKS